MLPQYFTIKAFWAELSDGSRLENCETQSPSLTEAMISRHRDDMLDYWPDLSKITYQDNVKTWKDQWKRYGTCAADILPAEDYITNTIAVRLHQRRNLFNILRDSGIVPNGKKYSSAKILSALHRYTETNVNIVCGMDDVGNVYLSEIHQCLDRNANKFVDCENKAINCFGDPIFPSHSFK
ncbi:hypothetical protein L6164_005665 [Bauhinia variegata]|uniref:Uncharacterized protein n=1 Tax=Bauhinia variegata TaxID=167791 RepID=A0ACB9PTV3_BAUVA|nr:hypothetical protein L6164_005665 [Bauhinia variegata]